MNTAGATSACETWILESTGNPQGAEERIEIYRSPFRIGRSTNLELTISAPAVSKLHATLLIDGCRCRLRDEGSTNGTFVNGVRIKAETLVHHGDMLQFAACVFHLKCQREAPRTPTVTEDASGLALALLQFDRLMNDRAVVPFLQPIVDLASRQRMGFEVLARSRMLGLTTASELFRTAALLKLEPELSRLLREAGCSASSRLGNRVPIFLNTHPQELQQPGLLESLQDLRRMHPALPLVLEIHEAAVTDSAEMRALRAALLESQIQLAYDDFGAGQSRLVELADVPPDYLKFDMSFVRDIDQAQEQRRHVLAMLVQLTKELGIVPIAEGIETPQEADTCRELGFTLGQGYLFGRPSPAETWHYSPS
jgi:EAL domain-containing protein (putative c-di-GMP-specific phosphodiesterase class I)